MSIHHDGEKAMIGRMHEILDQTDVVVHYNGRKFDVPILNKDFVTQGLAPPDGYSQVDLLQTARRRFRFASNKLDFVSTFLGLESKHQHKGMRLWAECMEGDETAWKTMKEYNIQDVKMLPILYRKLLPWIQDHPNHGLYVSHENPVCTNCGSSNLVSKGFEHLMTQSYRRLRCNACGTPLRERTTALPLSKRRAILTSSKL
jgi:DNA-directed RNA polymerase subunit RPC12/RpoP